MNEDRTEQRSDPLSTDLRAPTMAPAEAAALTASPERLTVNQQVSARCLRVCGAPEGSAEVLMLGLLFLQLRKLLGGGEV